MFLYYFNINVPFFSTHHRLYLSKTKNNLLSLNAMSLMRILGDLALFSFMCDLFSPRHRHVDHTYTPHYGHSPLDDKHGEDYLYDNHDLADGTQTRLNFLLDDDIDDDW